MLFTSDTHFGHKNIIKHSNRPFANVDEMTNVIVNNYNRVTNKHSIIYHLGDFSFYKPAITLEIIASIDCKEIVLIKGNHDKNLDKLLSDKFRVHDYLELGINDKKVVLFHFPLYVWNKSHYGSYHLHGHSHNSLNPQYYENRKSLDVGVDNPLCDYGLFTFDMVDKLLKDKTFKAVDHHNEQTR